MKTLQIEIPKGFKVESFDENSGLLKFAPLPKDIKERINEFKDVLDYLGEDDEDVKVYDGLLEADMPPHIVDYAAVILITKAYNEKQVPDYNDSNQVKYEPRFKLSSSGVGFSYYDNVGWGAGSLVGSRLVFLNFDNMKDAVKKFLPIYKNVQNQ